MRCLHECNVAYGHGPDEQLKEFAGAVVLTADERPMGRSIGPEQHFADSELNGQENI
jgi:hypothetical protein